MVDANGQKSDFKDTKLTLKYNHSKNRLKEIWVKELGENNNLWKNCSTCNSQVRPEGESRKCLEFLDRLCRYAIVAYGFIVCEDK